MQLFGLKKHLDTEARKQKDIYDSLASKMYAVCLRYMGNKEDAQDVLQNGFLTLFSKLDSYSGLGSFEGWARKIFVNTALMTLRKKDVLRNSEEMDAASAVPSPEETTMERIGYEELLDMIAALPPGFRTVFNMYVVEGYSHKEIGQALDISENTSRSQLQRARVILQQKIKEKYQDD